MYVYALGMSKPGTGPSGAYDTVAVPLAVVVSVAMVMFGFAPTPSGTTYSVSSSSPAARPTSNASHCGKASS